MLTIWDELEHFANAWLVAKAIMQKEDYDNRLSKRDFKAYIEAVCSMLPGGEDNFDPLIEFLMTSIEVCFHFSHILIVISVPFRG